MSRSPTTRSDRGASVFIRVRSHHFLIKDPNNAVRSIIKEFTKPLIKWDTKWVGGRPVRTMNCVYATANAARSEYRFAINFLPKFIKALTNAGIPESEIVQYNDHPGRGAKVHQQFKEGFNLREKQVAPLEYLQDKTEPRCKLLELQTGSGKTVTTLKAVELEGRGAAYFMPAKYLVNWEEAVEEFLDPSVENIFIEGSDEIRKLIKNRLAKKGPVYANYFFSSNTFGKFIKMWERDPKRFKRDYKIHIDQFFKLLGIDTVVVDEAHEFLHFNVKLWCYTNVYRTISLSGTYESKDRLEVLVQNTLHPMETRREREEYRKYSDSFCWLFEVFDPERVQVTEYNDEKYSHNAFERHLLKNPERRERYFTLMHEALRVEYFETRRENQSCLVFCAAVDTCMGFSEWLKKRYPNEKITFFVAGSDFTDDFLTADIVISTHGKSGTALDKPGLCTVIQTIGMDGNRGFKQAFGRIREIKGQRTRYAHLTASNLDKPLKYFEEKYELLEKMSLSVQKRIYPHRI